MTALELLRRRLHHRGQTLLPALTVLLAAACTTADRRCCRR